MLVGGGLIGAAPAHRRAQRRTHPRSGKHDLVFLPDRFVICTAKADVDVPYSAVRQLAIFDSIPKDTKGRVLLFLSLGSKVLHGKVALSSVVISTLESAELSVPSPKGGAQLAGPAAVVLCQAFGLLGLDPSCFCSPNLAVYCAAGGAVGVQACVKARTGILFPLPAAFCFLEAPALFVPHSEVRCAELLRASGTSHTFDVALHLRDGSLLEFGQLAREEAGRMQEYLSRCKLLGEPGSGGEGESGSGGEDDDSVDSQDQDFDPESRSSGEEGGACKARGRGAASGPGAGGGDGSDSDDDEPSGGSSADGSDSDGSVELVSEDEFTTRQLRSVLDEEQRAAKRKHAEPGASS